MEHMLEEKDSKMNDLCNREHVQGDRVCCSDKWKGFCTTIGQEEG